MADNPLQTFKEYLNAVLDKHRFYEMSEKYFEKNGSSTNGFHFTKSELNDIKDWEEAYSFCEGINYHMWKIFRNKYGRDRKNDGKALLEKVHPFEYEFGKIHDRVNELRIDEMKKKGTYPFEN
ncbi:hypothetical protein [Enterococcus sp. DIV0800]|uniref:hypothetical protein n=1 Tax=unclassified Enterococcus TaxID=2608891 RepID=UPI003D2FCCFB